MSFKLASPSTAPSKWIERGSPQFLRVTFALFSAGLATFALLYYVQPILPIFSKQFGISPAESSIALSLSTVFMALGSLFTGPLSDIVGRKSIMLISLILASIFTLLCTIVTSWHGILIMRAFTGLALSGVAAVGMTYLSEEIHPYALSFSIGLYISGNSIGGMSGRLFVSILTDYFSWTTAVSVISCFSFLSALIVWKLLPTSRHFRPVSLCLRKLLINFCLQWRDKALPFLFSEGFLLMGAFVTLFNYIGYRLLSAPWFLSQTLVGLISMVYLTGSWSSPKAGIMINRFGRSEVIIGGIVMMFCGLIFMLFQSLYIIFLGMILFTIGFFASHSVTSSWVGLRARRAKGQASSLYLFSYYIGSSVSGTLGGICWYNSGWYGVSIFISMLLILALFIGLCLKKRT
ncbi:putative transport protein [Candidatus Pantoea carbekii]|uniref:Putative transport protein n=1 Tax=Candidatus Pantoea carbekii TaxID=1235990 RepID=U3U6M0_9GAMM|nr:MFS transporter [Candidatus Pantoea carbekii]BAO00605.1 putative transport protein [Candidatus Pantoea carbekii]